MSLLSRLQLSLVALCSKDETRLLLNHLHVKGQTVEVTNGHTLVRVTRTDELKEEDFPAIMPTDSTYPKEVLIHWDAATKALKALPKRPSIPILENARVLLNGKNILLGTTNLVMPQVLTLQPYEGAAFPNMDQVIPKKEDGKFSIAFNPQLLVDVCKYAAQFGRQVLAEFTFYGSELPMRVDWTEDGHTATAVIMPMRMAPGRGKAMPDSTPNMRKLDVLQKFFDVITTDYKAGNKKAVWAFLKETAKAEETAKKAAEDASVGVKPFPSRV
jgi:hypothetical protein